MPTTCEIQFDNNPMKVVYAGQLLRGTVRLTITGQKDVRGVYIEIRGKAYARWTEGTGDNRKTYTGSEDYLNERTYFVGGSSGNELHSHMHVMRCNLFLLLLQFFFWFCLYFERKKKFFVD